MTDKCYGYVSNLAQIHVHCSDYLAEIWRKFYFPNYIWNFMVKIAETNNCDSQTVKHCLFLSSINCCLSFNNWISISYELNCREWRSCSVDWGSIISKYHLIMEHHSWRDIISLLLNLSILSQPTSYLKAMA